jgi:lysophospholipase L1-like esterase
VVLSAGLALATVEIVLRLALKPSALIQVEASGFHVYDPLLGWSLAPGAHARERSREYDVAVRINSQGFRDDREPALEPPAGVERIVAVGDSFTFGQGVELAETYPFQLGRRLGNAEVLNLGVPGYGVDQQYLMMRSRGLCYRPALVVLGIHTPDIFRSEAAVHNGYGKPVFRLRNGHLKLTNVPVPPPGAASPPPRPGLLNRSVLLGMVSTRLKRHGLGEVWGVTEGLLLRAAREAEAADARLLVVLLPTRHAIYGSPLERGSAADTRGRIARILRTEGIDYLDLAPSLSAAAAANRDEPLYYPQDGHFTPAGHRVAAEALASHLRGG